MEKKQSCAGSGRPSGGTEPDPEAVPCGTCTPHCLDETCFSDNRTVYEHFFGGILPNFPLF